MAPAHHKVPPDLITHVWRPVLETSPPMIELVNCTGEVLVSDVVPMPNAPVLLAPQHHPVPSFL